MKTNKIICLCFAVIAITACKKEKPHPIGLGTFNSSVNMRKIEQKSMDVSPEQALAIIKKFKAGADAHKEHTNARLVEADSISVDSSIFVIEAALNYDFDAAIDSSYEAGTDTTELTISFNAKSRMIASDDLETAYEQLTNVVTAICQANGGTSIRAIDIEAYEADNDHIVLKAKVLQVMSVLKNPCMYTSTANASPYWQYYTTWYLGSGPTPVPPRPDAATILNGLLNCQRFKFCPTGGSIYYINIVTLTKSSINTLAPVIGTNPTNPNPSALFSSPWMSQAAMYTTYVSLTPAQINTYRSGCSALIASNTPSGKVNIQNQIMQFAMYDQAPKWCIYWKLNMTYATDAGCRPIPPR